MSSVVYDGVTYSTGPDMVFDIVSSTGAQNSPINYYPKFGFPTGDTVSEMIDDEANWVWNSNTNNLVN